MAVRVDGPHFGELVDPYAGRADLDARLIRVLHPVSFQDDPTRVFRALRYAHRLGFHLTPDTEALLPPAFSTFAVLSGERLRHELELVFREAQALAILDDLARRGVLSAVHPALAWSPTEAADARVVPSLPLPAWLLAHPLPLDSIYLALLLRRAAPTQVETVLDRLTVTRAILDAVTGALGLSLTGHKPSEVVEQLDRLTLDATLTAFVAQPQIRDRVDAYLSRWRHIRAIMTGDDLVALGLSPGPSFKRLLARLRAARLDGLIHDEAGELALVRGLAGLE
jgi:tRNA nucleotidyltransferase (CCA-adding enzyme)